MKYKYFLAILEKVDKIVSETCNKDEQQVCGALLERIRALDRLEMKRILKAVEEK